MLTLFESSVVKILFVEEFVTSAKLMKPLTTLKTSDKGHF